MPRTLIIGYGNRLRGDDAIGPMAAERLREIVCDPTVEILALHQLTPELMEPISRAGRVIFIDAAAAGEPGALEERPVTADSQGGNFTHHSTPGGLLAGARAFFGHAPEATLYTVRGEDFSFGQHLTPRTAKALLKVLEKVQLSL
jgi:hydrogenase maturation protease